MYAHAWEHATYVIVFSHTRLFTISWIDFYCLSRDWGCTGHNKMAFLQEEDFNWHIYITKPSIMMTSSNGNIFRVTGHLSPVISPHKGQWRGALMFYPAALKRSGVLSLPERAGGRAAGQTSPVNTLTTIILHGSFSNLARTFITLRFRTSSIMEVRPHYICA